MVFEVDFAHDAHLVPFQPLLGQHRAESRHRLFHQFQHPFGIPLQNQSLGLLQERVPQSLDFRSAFRFHPDHRGMVELGEIVPEENRAHGDRQRLEPIDLEARLVVVQARTEAYRNDGHSREAGIDQGLLENRVIIGSPALPPGLGDSYRAFFRIVLARFQSFYDIAHNQRGRVADLVVGIFQPHLGRILVAERQHFQFVAVDLEQFRQERRDVFGKERRKDFPPLVLLLKDFGRDKRRGFRVQHMLVAKALDQASDTELHRTHVVDIVNLDHRGRFLVAVQHVGHFVQEESVRSAAKGSHLRVMHVFVLHPDPFGRLDDLVDVIPLGEDVGVLHLQVLLFVHDFLVDDRGTQVGSYLAELVLHQRVGMVGTAR